MQNSCRRTNIFYIARGDNTKFFVHNLVGQAIELSQEHIDVEGSQPSQRDRAFWPCLNDGQMIDEKAAHLPLLTW
jgi:hypothetical protein